MATQPSCLHAACTVLSVFIAVYHGKALAAAATTTVTTPTMNSTLPPVTCLGCEGLLCWTQPRSVTCDVTTPLCMSHVTDHIDGTRDLRKGCASLAECQTKFLQTTLNTTHCADVEKQVTGLDIDCFFCCQGNDCNRGPNIIPPQNLLLVG